ncbi:MAG: hypothetical protein JOY62_19375 [Acidobacteriaceae bacterium]|nr:hypothetical protein [Acidobacteriaceae bacterium]
MCSEFRAFGRDILARKTGEIGTHLHAWNAPPVKPLLPDDYKYLPFLIEYSADVMRAKVEYQTGLLSDVFGVQPVSHRAGRWALDTRYIELLIENGYRVDCSVTPGVSWRAQGTAPLGRNGSDYRSFPVQPYWVDPSNISRPGSSPLLEVPMTIYCRAAYDSLRPQVLRSFLRRIRPDQLWLRPNGRNVSDLKDIVRRVRRERRSYAEFMLHSSEFMPGGSPIFRTSEDVEKLYSDLCSLFSAVSDFRGATLQEYLAWYDSRN